MANTTVKTIIDLIRRSNKILILPSSPIDGDSIGSAVSLYMVLHKMGKEATVIASDPVPEVLQFLPNVKIVGEKIVSTNDFIITIDCKHSKIDKIRSEVENDKVNIIITPRSGRFTEDEVSFNKGEIEYDLIIAVDTAELKQLKSVYENNVEMFHQVPVVNIDHHVSNAQFGKVNYTDIMASATTEMLYAIYKEFENSENNQLIDEDIATLLLTGIITDTGSFQNANTTPKAFAVAAELVSYGARQQEIIQHIYKTKQLSQLKLWGRVLSKIQTDDKYRLVWSSVSQKDFLDTESSEDQTGDIIDELMTNAPGAEIVILIKEKADKTISVSVRTLTPEVDANKFAELFGGGGHNQAAGFRMNNITLQEAEFKIVEAVKKFQEERIKMATHIENEERPMIDVPELLKRVEMAEKATKNLPKVDKKTSKKKEKKTFEFKAPETPEHPPEDNSSDIIYKFED